MSLNVDLLESSFNLVAPKAGELMDRFYGRLFKEHPEVRSIFPDSMDDQKKHLATSLATIVGSLRQPEKLKKYLEDLGLGHVQYRVEREHYPIVGQTLLTALAEVAGDAWNAELEKAWADAYGAIQSIIYGALDAQGSAAA